MNGLKRTTRWRLFAILFTCCLCFTIGLAQAASPFFWDAIHVDIVLEENGDLLITEAQTYVFKDTHNNQRYRYIPLDRVDHITDIEVYEDNKLLSHKAGIESNQQWIRWQHLLNRPESHTFVIKYRVVGGLQHYGQGFQIYWQAIFPDRSASIKRSTVTVHIPEKLSDQKISIKSEGVRALHSQLDATTIQFFSTGELKPQQFLNIQIMFPENIYGLKIETSQSRKITYGVLYILQRLLFGVLVFSMGAFVLVGLVVKFIRLLREVLSACNYYRKWHRCPECKMPFLRRPPRRVLRTATSTQDGEYEIHVRCYNCFYSKTSVHKIPYSRHRSADRGDPHRRYYNSRRYPHHKRNSYGGGSEGGGGGGGGGGAGGGGGGG